MKEALIECYSAVENRMFETLERSISVLRAANPTMGLDDFTALVLRLVFKMKSDRIDRQNPIFRECVATVDDFLQRRPERRT